MKKKLIGVLGIIFTLGCLYYMSKGLVGITAAYILITFHITRVIAEILAVRFIANKSNIREDIKEEIPRKTGHLLIALVTMPMIYWSFKGTIHLIIFPLLGLVLTYILNETGLLKELLHRNHKEDDNLAAIVYAIVALLITGSLSLINPKFSMPCLLGFAALGLGDPCACIIGKLFGKHKIYDKKTIEGFIGFIIGATISMYLFSGVAVWKLIIIAAIGAIAELFSKDYDNLFIPIAVCITAFFII